MNFLQEDLSFFQKVKDITIASNTFFIFL